MNTPEQIQMDYYTRTAEAYDETHVHSSDEHYVSLRYISAFLTNLHAKSVLDVGCGTGRAVRYFLDKHPNIQVRGIDPVQALLSEAVNKNGISAEVLDLGSGKSLPYDSHSFDIVCSFGVLHHVKNPNEVVNEMLRVARKAVFISDMNRFGMGRFRWGKLLISKFGLFNLAYRLKTGGKGYVINENDGLFYSYSVFDSFDVLASKSKQVITIPTKTGSINSWMHPLLTSSHVLLGALMDDL